MRENIIKTFDEDIYNRKIIAENLTKIIESQNNQIVISLDAPWGTGKTTFVTMWKHMLDTNLEYKEKFKTLYFNAWENDYVKDPLLALFSEMIVKIKEEDSKLKQSFDNVKAKLKPIAKLGLTTGAKILTAGILDLDKVKLGDFNESELIDLAGKIGELSIEEVAASKTVRNNFKEAMKEYQDKSGKKLVFFIDELDRCRPTFAIELLEVIKHLFDIDNCVFIISIDKEQLSHSVSTIYGNNMDTVGYLRRFFDLDYRLPSIDIKTYIENKNQIVFKNYYNTDLFKFFLKEQFELEHFSLRDVDKAYYYINMLLPLIKPFNKEKANEYYNWKSVYIATISYLYSILIATKIKHPILFNKTLSGIYTTNEIAREFPNIKLSQNATHICGWHIDSLTELIEPILNLYLELNLEIKKYGEVQCDVDNKYMVGLKKDTGKFDSEYSYPLLNLFKNNSDNLNNNLEFINSFKVEI